MTFKDFKKLISYVESNNNSFAIRFESELYKHAKSDPKILETIKSINVCSTATAKMIYCSSWGKYQIMGFNIYGICKFDREIGAFLCNEWDQDKAFKTFLLAKYKKPSSFFHTQFVNDIKRELIMLSTWKESCKTYSEFVNMIKINYESFPTLRRFISRYNGSRLPSDHAIDYLLRMLYYYDKKIKKTEV